MPEPRSKTSGIGFGAALLLAAATIGFSVRVGWRATDSASAFGKPATAIEANGPRATAARELARRPEDPAARSRRRASDPAPLPVAGTPLAQMYDTLERRVASGDDAATRRLFHEVHRCNIVQQERRVLAEITPIVAANENRGDASIGTVRGNRVDVTLVSHVKDFVQRNTIRCEGVTAAQLQSITPLTLRMARIGDLGALDCYIGSDFETMEGLLDHPEWMAQYRTEVPALVQSALQHGDWVAVELLRQAYSGSRQASPLGQLFGSDPAMAYRLLRLQRLGAIGSLADDLEPRLAAAARDLSPDQIAAADAWANDYSRYFSSASNDTFDGSGICEFADD